MAEGEGEAAAPVVEEKKSKKKLIIIIVAMVVIGLLVAKMTVLAPPPPTAAQVAAKAAAEVTTLHTKCALANGLTPPAPAMTEAEKKAAAAAPTTTTTTMAPVPTDTLQVLTADSVTINLADGHFLKVGVGFQLPAGIVADTAKTAGYTANALTFVLTTLRQKTTADLGPTALEPLREQLGYAICASEGAKQDHGMDYKGAILTIFFSDFVTQ